MRKLTSNGFTIVEMMIATAVFSVILLVVTAGVLAFSKQYMQGQTASNLQFTGRQIVAQVGQDVQFGGTVDNSGGGTIDGTHVYEIGCYRLGANIYLYQIGSKVGDGQHGLVMIPNVSQPCATLYPSFTVNTLKNAMSQAGARELLSNGQRLLDFSVNSPGPTSPYNIKVKLAGGEDDMLTDGTNQVRLAPATVDWGNLRCKTGAGREYCAVLTLSGAATKRV